MAKKNNLVQKPNKLPANQPTQIVLQKIDVRKPMRTEQDIPKWRNAIKSAEGINPRRRLLYTLYADVVLDGHVESVMGKRFDAVTSANWQFVDKEGKPIDEVNQLIDTIGFDELLTEIINSKFWGYSILEPKFWKGVDDTWEMSAGLLPRYHYRPEMGVVSFDAISDDGINIREGVYAKTIMEVGKTDDLGLLVKASPYQVLKRGGLGDYAAFIQTYGNPLIDATWDGFDEAQRLALKEALTGLGAGGNIIRPEGTTIDVKENNAKNTGDAHGSFLSFLNKEISKALLGSTETTESSTSSGYAQAETHADQDNNKHYNDITYVRKYLNSRFIRIMQAYGFNTQGGSFIVQGEDTQLTQAESFTIHSKLATDHKLPIDDDFWYETYGVPKPDNYDAIKKEQAAKEVEEPPTPEPPNTKKPKAKSQKPKTNNKEEKEQEVTLTFLERLKKLFLTAPAVTTGATGNHIALSKDTKNNALIQRIWNAKGTAIFDATLFWENAYYLNKGFKEGFNKGNEIKLTENPAFTYNYDDPAILTHFERSIYRFAGQKNIAILQQLNQLFRQSKSFEEFYSQADTLLEVANKNWLETEYVSANLTGEAAATYNRLIAQIDIFPYWEYKTMGDDLVRASHVPLNGLILPADDKLWLQLFPPNGWRCRCYVVPRMAHEVTAAQLSAGRKIAKAYLDSPRAEKDTAAGWGSNKLKNGLVFTDNQQYNNKFNSQILSEINKLKAHNFGLKDSKEVVKTGKDQPPSAEDAQQKTAVKDYQNRTITTASSGSNMLLYAAMQKALAKPDEVWLQGKELEQMVYVKYFLNKPIIVLADVYPNRTVVKQYLSTENVDKYRKGLLILKNE
ncbi:phage portal protein family protein [Cellulophaga lytica]|uniref:phage portal protein family protein n=1 Tax=Cellulophaga lytica TaxID=979 RepID=UPI003CE486EC